MNYIKQLVLCSVFAVVFLNRGYCDDLVILKGEKFNRLCFLLLDNPLNLFNKENENLFNKKPEGWTESDFETLRTALKNEVTTDTNQFPTDATGSFLKSVDKRIDEMKQQQKEIQQQLAEARREQELYNEKVKQEQEEEQRQLAAARQQQELVNQKKEQQQAEQQEQLEQARQNENLAYENQTRKAQHNNHILLATAAVSFVMSIVIYFALHRRKIKQLKSTIEFLTVSKSGSPLAEEKKVLEKETAQQDSKWEKLKPQIVSDLIAEYKHIISGDARAIILESVALRIEEGVQNFQSFLPPSVRLPARHYAQFLFDEDDVEKFEAEQNNIAKLLEEKLVPDYENKTVVWVDDSEDADESETSEDSDDEEEVEDESEDDEK